MADDYDLDVRNSASSDRTFCTQTPQFLLPSVRGADRRF